MPPMPRPATRPVTLTLRLSSTTIVAIAKMAMVTSRRMMPIALPRPLISSIPPARCSITPSTSSRTQSATWSVSAEVKNTATVAATASGASE